MSEIREVVIAPSALTNMRTHFQPNEAEIKAIVAVLTALKSESKEESLPSNLGYRIPFMVPPTFRVDVGRFRIHYTFADKAIQVGYLGVY